MTAAGPVLVLASRNEKKLRELQAILKDLPLNLLSLRDFSNAPEIEEDGHTFEENASKKALLTARSTGVLALADDSGLCVDCLDGSPGVRSARFAGDAKDDEANCRKLLELMEHVPAEERSASFHCVIALACPDRGVIGIAQGQYSGRIAHDRKGHFGFGYDPVFVDPASGKHFAELEPAVKNQISHRAQALKKAKDIISQYLQHASSQGKQFY